MKTWLVIEISQGNTNKKQRTIKDYYLKKINKFKTYKVN